MENYISEIVRTLDIYGVMCIPGQHSGDDPGFLITCCLARIVCINILATLKSHSHFSFQEIVKIHLGGLFIPEMPHLILQIVPFWRVGNVWHVSMSYNSSCVGLMVRFECYRDPMRPLFCWTVHNGSIYS